MSDLVVSENDTRRITQAADVSIRRMADPKLSVEDACAAVGIEERTYYRWVKKGEDTIEVIRGFIADQQRMMLMSLVVSQAEAIRLLNEDAVDTGTSTKDRVIAMSYLDQVREELERQLHAAPGVEEDAHRFLKQGPNIELKKSRLASIEVRGDDDGGVTVDVFKESEIIDVTPHSQEGPGRSDLPLE
jgi:hypothetical protein